MLASLIAATMERLAPVWIAYREAAAVDPKAAANLVAAHRRRRETFGMMIRMIPEQRLRHPYEQSADTMWAIGSIDVVAPPTHRARVGLHAICPVAQRHARRSTREAHELTTTAIPLAKLPGGCRTAEAVQKLHTRARRVSRVMGVTQRGMSSCIASGAVNGAVFFGTARELTGLTSRT